MKAAYEAEMQKIVARFWAGESITDLAFTSGRDRLDIEAIIRAEMLAIEAQREAEAARLEDE